jgi:hypothetical protein
MHHYHFTLQNNGSQIDDLGGVVLTDDAEALDFGKRVIRELLHENPEQHARWTMDITDGERTICSIALV